MTRTLRHILWVLALPAVLSAATFPVTTINDGGAGSLREAIVSANATPGPDAIGFAISGSGVHRILVTTALPPITEAVIIDGFTQPGSAPNTDPVGNNAVLMIELAGSGFLNGLVIHGGPTTIRGLAIFDFFGAIVIDSPTGPNLVAGNFLGVDAAAVPMGNLTGVTLTNSSSDTVGGASPAERNVISSGVVGVQVDSGSNKRILGNLIGTDRTGTASLGNDVGVWIADSDAVTVGAAAPGQRNVISGNLGDGVRISDESGAYVAGNYIGTDATGFAALPNGGRGVNGDGAMSAALYSNVISGNASDGVYFGSGMLGNVHSNLIGTDASGITPIGNSGAGVRADALSCFIGDTFGGGNTIAFNQVGVWMNRPVLPHYALRSNSIYANGGLGIVSGPSPIIRPNTAGSLDNFPLITSVTSGGGSTTVHGFYRGAPQCGVAIDFYANPACAPRPRAFDEGQTYLGSGGGQSDDNGLFTFDVTLPITLDGEVVTATATAGNCSIPLFPGGGFDERIQTSQFSQRLPFSITPSSGPASGAPLTIFGTDFAPGALVDIGDISVENVTVVGPNEIQVMTPALPAGTANNVVVTNLDGTAGGLTMAWVADFLDVPPSHPFHDFVTAVVSNGIAAGTGGGFYGVTAATLRQQMAVFLVRAEHGFCYIPAGCAGVFGDVPCSSPFASWIEQLAAEGITGGCGGGNFCPADPVTRAQMAVFLLKARHGSSHAPPACAGVFGDVPCPSQFADWIEQLASDQITGGCGGGNYCPQSPNTRGQMAVFLQKTFQLP